MSVHKFPGRPELDEEIMTALEQQREAERILVYFVEQRSAIGKVCDALPRTAKPSLLSMLDDDLTSLDHDIDVAEGMVSDWKEIVGLLRARTARP